MNSIARRAERFGQGLGSIEAGVALVTSPANIFYLTGMQVVPFERLVCLVVGADGNPVALLPELEAEYATACMRAEQVVTWRDGEDPLASLREVLITAGVRSHQVLGVEMSRVSLALGNWIRREFPRVRIVDIGPLLDAQRMRKERGEIECIRRACELTVAAYREVLTRVRPGMTELQVAAHLELLLKSGGADGAAYPTAVLSGPRSALPHGRTSPRQIEKGDLVLIDAGASYAGYCADFTRTVVVGGRGSRECSRLHRIVVEAQEEARQMVREGVRVKDVDGAARRVIEAAGYGSNFVHRTGHGLGIEIHEPPSVACDNAQPLEQGMVVTVEPGIYVSSLGGIRVEDVVVVTATGPEILTDAARELLEL